MTFEQLFTMIEKAALSPEQFGSYLGISGMTIRRWQDQDPKAQVPELYQLALAKTVENLIMEGFLKVTDDEVKPFIKDRDVDNLKLNFQTLGLDLDELKKLETNSEKDIHMALGMIGESPKRQEQVVEHVGEIRRLASIHRGMKKSVQSLLAVITQKDIGLSKKLVAFGALFYLIAPLDLIPDTIPIFGYIDDIAILNLAAMYYASGRGQKTKVAAEVTDTPVGKKKT